MTQPAPPAAALPLCPAADLADGGTAHVFDLLEHGQPARGFVLRHGGQVVGYLNQCAHVPAEMDWKEGQFLDGSGQWILCSIHGAVYEPATGYCVGGPCRGRRLKPLQIEERDGQVSWYPSATLTPVFGD